MKEGLDLLLTYVWVVIHHRWIAIVTTVLFVSAGWVYAQYIPDEYKVQTRIVFDTKTVLKPLLKGIAVDNTMLSQSAMAMRSTMLSRANLLKVAAETDMDLSVFSDIDMEHLLKKLRNNTRITLSGIEGSRRSEASIYTISHVHENPELAKKVVESFLNIFMETILGVTRRDTDSAEEFLHEQIKEYAGKLEEAETRLKLFKQENIGLMPQDGRTYFSRLEALKLKLESNQLLLKEKISQTVVLERQIREAENISITGGSVGSTPLDSRISDLEFKLDELYLSYTDNHPDVIATKSILEQLRKRKEAEVSSGTGNRGSDNSYNKSSDLYQNLKFRQSELEGEIIALKTRKIGISKKIVEMNQAVNTIPAVEAALVKLNRDYSIIKNMHDKLIMRSTSAEISREANIKGRSQNFNIMEPPRLPQKPFSPNRPLLISAVLFFGLIGGCVVAIAYEQLKPTYYTIQQFEDEFDIPVIGTISMFWSEHEVFKRNKEFVFFGVILTSLLLIYVFILLQYGFNIDVIRKIPGIN